MGEWYSALGGGVVLSGHEIYRRIRSSRGSDALGMAASASSELADRYIERMARTTALTQKMDAAWRGTASAGATSALRPMARAFEDSQPLLMSSRDALVDQASGFWRAFREVQYVPPTAPAPDTGLFDGFGPESDVDRAITDYNDKAQRNVEVYNDYHHQSVANRDRMPASYPSVLSGDGPSVTVNGDGRGPSPDHRSEDGRSEDGQSGVDPAGVAPQGTDGGTGSGVADTGRLPAWGDAVTPQTSGGSATQPQSRGPQGTLVPSGQSGGVPVEPRSGGSGGWGPGASGGWGPGELGSAERRPDARGGVGVVSPSPGVAGRSAHDGRAGLPRGGVGGWPEDRTRVRGEALQLKPGTGGGSALGGEMWGAHPNRPDDDREHHRRYWRPPDSEDLFGIDDVVVAPSVIGAEPEDGDGSGDMGEN